MIFLPWVQTGRDHRVLLIMSISQAPRGSVPEGTGAGASWRAKGQLTAERKAAMMEAKNAMFTRKQSETPRQEPRHDEETATLPPLPTV